MQACYLLNRSSLMALVDKTPYEAWVFERPSFAHLRVFGFDAFVHFLKEKIIKIDNKYNKCIFNTYKDRVKGYKLWNPVTRKVVYSIHVIFKEVGGTSRNENNKREMDPKKLEFE